jgi:ribose transport system substrate-binding protein
MVRIKIIILFIMISIGLNAMEPNKKLAYIVSDMSIPFWQIMSKGIKSKALELGYEIEFYSSNNLKKIELENIATVLNSKVDGLIISPINSSTAVTILDIAKKANLPVVISDIGADSEDYVSFISSDNLTGAYELGKILSKKLIDLNWDKDGTVGIIAIPQKRTNGKDRTNGFLKALNESNIKSTGIYQQVDFSYKETYDYSIKLINQYPNLKAIWLQGSDKYKGALDAIKDSNKEGKILLICFDAEPEFLDLIPKEILVGSAMQQPYLMGSKAVEILDDYLNKKEVKKEYKLPILAISKDNIQENLPKIKINVLGIK